MKIRKLRCRGENAEWYIDSYACEVDPHLVVFRYNSKTWGRLGAIYNHKIRKANAMLENLEDIILQTSDVTWLPVETLTANEIKALDEACAISDRIGESSAAWAPSEGFAYNRNNPQRHSLRHEHRQHRPHPLVPRGAFLFTIKSCNLHDRFAYSIV